MTTIPWHPFIWYGETLAGRYFPHAAMFVRGELPALDGLTGLYQFDLGAPKSMLYAKSFTSEQQARLEAYRIPNRQMHIGGGAYPMLDLTLKIGAWTLTGGLGWHLEMGDPEPDEDGALTLGTLGSDFVHDKVLAIDYPGQRLALLEKLPDVWEQAAVWARLRVTEFGLILIQIQLDGTPIWVAFDTGSSIFHFLTDEKRWRAWTSGDVTDTLPITAWGQSQVVYGGPPMVDLALEGIPLDLPLIYYQRKEGLSEFLERFESGGLMGNAPFLDKTIILDFIRGRFGVLAASA